MSLLAWHVCTVLQGSFQSDGAVGGEEEPKRPHLCGQMQQALLQGAREAGELGLCLLGPELLCLHPASLCLRHSLNLYGQSAAHLHPKALTTLDCSCSCREDMCQTMTQASEGRCAYHEFLLELF